MIDTIRNAVNAVNAVYPKAATFVSTLCEGRRDINIMTKAIQVFTSSVDLVNNLSATKIFVVLNPKLKTASEITYFWSILTPWRNWCFPVTADSIDAQYALDQLKSAAVVFPDFANLSPPGGLHHPERLKLDFVMRYILKQQLDTMNSKGSPSYRDAQDFARALANRFEIARSVCVEGEPVPRNGGYDFSACIVRATRPQVIGGNPNPDFDHNADGRSINLANPAFLAAVRAIPFRFHQPSLLERITQINWLSVDINTDMLCFKMWRMIDTGSIANMVGRIPIFGKTLANLPLEVAVRGGIVVGCVLNLINLAGRWRNAPAGADPVNADRAYKRKLDTAANVADLVYHGTCLINESGIKAISQPWIDVLSIAARSIGIYCIYNQPKPAYTRILDNRGI